jgi:hypothetical protein
MKVWLAIAVAGWTLLAWGGRIGLLVGGEGFGSWMRIGGSILIGLFAASTLVLPRLESIRRPTLVVFALFTAVLWARSMYVNWTGSGSLPFKLVHTVLAMGFYGLALWALSVARAPASARGDAISGPDETHGQQQAEGEQTRLSEG